MDTNIETLLQAYLIKDPSKIYSAVLTVLSSYLLQRSPPSKTQLFLDGDVSEVMGMSGT